MTGTRERLALRGIAASGGVGVGRAVLIERHGAQLPRYELRTDAIDGEVQRLRDAIEASRKELAGVRESLTEDHKHDYGLILDAHMMMHRDELLIDQAVQTIREEGVNAEFALRQTIDSLEDQLEQAGLEYFRERAQDVEHVGQHILRHLTGSEENLPDVEEGTVLIADDLSPADAARLLDTPVEGLVVATGTTTSHSAILARALEVPAVVGVVGLMRRVEPGSCVVVDGLRGEVVVEPASEERERAEARGERYRRFTGRLRAQRHTPSTTRDGAAVEIHANVELPAEAALAVNEAADGIGLYRTEFLYLDRDRPPSEEDQLAIYRDVVRVMAPRTVTFRTFDLGGDKIPSSSEDDHERSPANPALGLRAIRLLLSRPEILETQIRAVLRAAVHGRVNLMLPMITTVEELRTARQLVERCCAELIDEGVSHRRVPVGVMIEVPSAVLMADTLARESDFFSVGTNDLIQYALALDRGNPDVAHLGSSLDPAVLKLLQNTMDASLRRDVPVTMCGDMASDPLALPLVVGLGYRHLSVPVASLALVREVVRRIEESEAQAASEFAVGCESTDQVRRMITERFGDVLGDLWEEAGVRTN